MQSVKNSLDKYLPIELAKRSLWKYEQYINSEFFKEDREYLKTLSDTLQQLYEGKLLKQSGEPYRKLMINLPPRHGKSYSLINFSQWCLGKNNSNKIITVSYNETLSSRFSKAVRNYIDLEKIDEHNRIFKDVFPATKVKRGDASYQLWSLEGQPISYLGSSPTGTLTGIGANIGIIDDLIKNKEEAFNDAVLEKHWDFYKDTFLSRLESNAIQIINFTRWSKKDLCGRLLDLEPDEWYILKMPVESNGQMLCEEILSLDEFEKRKRITSKEIIQANYYQEPIDLIGVLYKSLKTYKELPKMGIVKNYTDTADEGDDYLCSICYLEHNSEAYILDILYTKEGAETTEKKTAELLERNEVRIAKFESNNGGKSFARNVQRHLRTNRTVIKWFHQSKNKIARIISNANWVQEHIYFPENWDGKWYEFAKDVRSFQKDGKNKHDDAQDVLSGIAEELSIKRIVM